MILLRWWVQYPLFASVPFKKAIGSNDFGAWYYYFARGKGKVVESDGTDCKGGLGGEGSWAKQAWVALTRL